MDIIVYSDFEEMPPANNEKVAIVTTVSYGWERYPVETAAGKRCPIPVVQPQGIPTG
jgi:hypothetical protein